MPTWLQVLAGIVGGLALIFAIIRVCIWLEERSWRRQKSWLAKPSDNWDTGPSVGGQGSYDVS